MDLTKQQLPPKENSLFKRLLKCYEQKQYKNGLKIVKQILVNHADHGETLAMKGLILNCLGRKDDAYTFARTGLRNNLQSHVCWHALGILHRSDKKYDEAIKCYCNALKWDKENLQILRDLSLLQIYMRDLDGYKETRYKLFQLRSTQRASWIGHAMSYHLLKDFDTALKILEEFRKTIHKTTYDYEYSELLLYQNQVMRESKKLHEALKHLDTYESNICDKVTLQELRGDIMLELRMKKESSEVYRGLVKRNPENRNYYLKLEETLGLTSVNQKLELYHQLKEKYPRAQVPKRLPLKYAKGEVLESLLDPYLRAALQKGVPALFTDLLSLYEEPARVQIIENLMKKYLKNLEETGHLCEEDNDYKEPASISYVLMYLGQHHSYLGDPDKALTLIERALELTPSESPALIDLYIVKGKILKEAGDYVAAYEALQAAQALDTADRYINSKATSYLLKANLVKQAEEMCSKFTGVSAMENLNEMQCMWFQTECAQAYLRLGQYGDALRKCHEVDRHFTEIIENQFDFHSYCIRKMTLRSYVELLRLEDILRSNRFYWDAAQAAIAIYLRLHDYPLSANTGHKDLNTANMNPAELRKFRSKQRKAANKAEQSKAEEKRREEKKAEYQNYKSGGNADEQDNKNDLIPTKLEQREDPLGEAIYFLKPLQSLAANIIETHIMAFEIYLRKDRPLLMLQSLKRALKLDNSNPDLHTCLVRFLHYRQNKLVCQTGPIVDVINKEVCRLLPTKEPTKLNEDFLNKNQDSIPHRLQAARSMVLLDSIQRDRGLSIATNVDSHLKGRTHQSLQKVLEWLESEEFSSTPEEISHYKAQFHAIFPRAQAFKPPPPASTSTNDCTSGHHLHSSLK